MEKINNKKPINKNEAGVIYILLALILPVLLLIISLAWAVQYTEGMRREDQTMVDTASADAALALDSTKWGYNMAIIKALESVRAQIASSVTSRNRDKIGSELDETIEMLREWMVVLEEVNGYQEAHEIYQGHTKYIDRESININTWKSHRQGVEFCFGEKKKVNDEDICEFVVQVQRGRYWPQNVVERWGANKPIPDVNFIYSAMQEHGHVDLHTQPQVSSNVEALQRFEPFEAISNDKINNDETGETNFIQSSWYNNDFALGTPNFVAANAVRVVIRRRLNFWMTLASFFKDDDNDYKIKEEALAVGGDIGDGPDDDSSVVRVAPFAIPACALVDPTGDFNPAYSCHLDRYFTNSDRFTYKRKNNGKISSPPEKIDTNPIPGAFWGPLTKSEYCDSPLDLLGSDSALEPNRAAMCACAEVKSNGQDGVPCSDENGIRSISCTFNAWQRHAKASNYYGVVGVPESSNIQGQNEATLDLDNDEDLATFYHMIFDCNHSRNNQRGPTIKGELNNAGISLNGGTLDARLGDRFTVIDKGLDDLDVGDALWRRMTGQCRDCPNGNCRPHDRNFETAYPFHNADHCGYSHADLFDTDDQGKRIPLTGSAHKELGFWYTLGRVHDKLGYPQVLGIQKSPLYAFYDAIGRGESGKKFIDGKNVDIDYNYGERVGIDSWRVAPNACEDRNIPQFGTCGSRRVRYDARDNFPSQYGGHKYKTPASIHNYDPILDPELWTLHPGNIAGFGSWNTWGGAKYPQRNNSGGEWSELARSHKDRNNNNWPNGKAPQSYIMPEENKCNDNECSGCDGINCGDNGYVWNGRRYKNAKEAFEDCKVIFETMCGYEDLGAAIAGQCTEVVCKSNECASILGDKKCAHRSDDAPSLTGEEIAAICRYKFANPCDFGKIEAAKAEFFKIHCEQEKEKERQECAERFAAEECTTGTESRYDFDEDDEECGDYQTACGSSCPPDDPDCRTEEEKARCQHCDKVRFDSCLEDRTSEILDSDQCIIADRDCDNPPEDADYRGIIPDECLVLSEDELKNKEAELEKEIQQCIEQGDANKSCSNVIDGMDTRCETMCNECAAIIGENSTCCRAPGVCDDNEDVMKNYWPSADGFRTSNEPDRIAYDPDFSTYGSCGTSLEIKGRGYKGKALFAKDSIFETNEGQYVEIPKCGGSDNRYCTRSNPETYDGVKVSEFICPFMPQYMPYALQNPESSTGEQYTPDNTRVWRVAIPVIADTNQSMSCNQNSEDEPVSDHNNGNWIIVGFVEAVIFDTDVGLGIQHAPGLFHSGNGDFPHTCDYEKGYALRVKGEEQETAEGEVSEWTDLRRGREPWQFTPNYDPGSYSDPFDDSGDPTACNMVRARLSCESQLLASRDFGRNAVRKVRVISK